jgi:hypothetical protein
LLMFSRCPCSLLAFEYDVHVRMRVIGVQRHRVSMLEGELFTAQVLDRDEHLVGTRSGRHGEHDFMGQTGRLRLCALSDLPAGTGLLEIEVPVIGQLAGGVPALQGVAVVGVQLDFALSVDVPR